MGSFYRTRDFHEKRERRGKGLREENDGKAKSGMNEKIDA